VVGVMEPLVVVVSFCFFEGGVCQGLKGREERSSEYA
jgi:hypothetical protein